MGKKSWKKFERLIAAIEKAADSEARVEWNAIINGRQFDVAVRFKRSMRDYLVVVECKDYTRPVEVEKIDAFVNKARAVNANRLVFASTSGFQSGCLDVARRDDVVLYRVGSTNKLKLPIGVEDIGVRKVVNITELTLTLSTGEKWVTPGFHSELEYYLNKVTFSGRSGRAAMNELIQRRLADEKLTDSPRSFQLSVDPGCHLRNGGEVEVPEGEVKQVSFNANLAWQSQLRSEVIYDPTMLLPDIAVDAIVTGEQYLFDLRHLPYRLDDPIEVGSYYEQPDTCRRYYVAGIDNEIVDLWLVEYFAHGDLVQAEMKQEVKYFTYAYKITDPATIRRLERRRAKMKE